MSAADIVYIVVRGQRVGHHWIESPIFNSAYSTRGDAEHFRQQAISDGLGGPTEITLRRFRVRTDLGLSDARSPRP